MRTETYPYERAPYRPNACDQVEDWYKAGKRDSDDNGDSGKDGDSGGDGEGGGCSGGQSGNGKSHK